MFILIWIKQENLTKCLFFLATKKGLYFCVFVLKQNMGSMLVFLKVQLINCLWYLKLKVCEVFCLGEGFKVFFGVKKECFKDEFSFIHVE